LNIGVDCGFIDSVGSKKTKDAIIIKPCVEKVNIQMKLDTGSAVSVSSHVDYRKYVPTLPLESTSVTLKTYLGEKIIPEGVMHVKVQYNNISANFDLYVVLSKIIGKSISKITMFGEQA
jgi:hypothetical protein